MTLDRAFLAVPLSAASRDLMTEIQARLAAGSKALRPVHPATLHLTLHFFGRLTEENLEKLKVSMLSVSVQAKPFEVDIQGLGVFPDLRRPRVLWLGLTPVEPLRSLHQCWRDALGRAGLPLAGKPYTPHLTIGRFRQRPEGLEVLLEAYAKRRFGRLTVDRLVLYESRLSPQGAEHMPVHDVHLQGDRSP